MIKCVGILMVLLVFGLTRYVSAETYQWTDSAGGVHFTDDLSKVPLKYQEKVKVRPSSAPAERPVSIPSAQQPVPEARDPRELEDRLRAGKSEEWWRAAFTDLRKESKKIADELPGKREELKAQHRKYVISMGRNPKSGETEPDRFFNKSPTSTLSKNRAAYYQLKSEIESDETRVKALDEKLKTLNLDADRAGVPMEWRR